MAHPSSGKRYAPVPELVAEITPLAYERLGVLEGEAFVARLEHFYPDIEAPLARVYEGIRNPGALVRELVLDCLAAAGDRPWPLRVLDRRREVDPGWFQRARMLGYVCYADRFAGSIQGVRRRIDYLTELGVTYLHLMSVLAPRDGENDGGYAVADYDSVAPRLGSMTDVEELATDLHHQGISLCIDLVLNHTAAEHPWARHAAAGDAEYRDFYLTYPDRQLPEAFERTLPEVFPDVAPGSFTYSAELDRWVWTTFHAYQWDLNYANPAVFRTMLQTMLRLANRGVDVIRLDAVPFLWKRLGTNCQNQPEVHWLVQAFRALTRLAAPGILLKAEAIVAPEMLVQYIGGHDRYRPECDLAYNNQLMVMLWSSLAARDSSIATRSLSRMRSAPPPTGWVTYLRCHDDIGWAVSDDDAADVGADGHEHRTFLSAFYAGEFPGSFSRGARFQHNPATGDCRISGTAASLCGIETALESGDPDQLDVALRRLETLYSVVFSFGGIPLIYMGDELAQLNDQSWAQDPAQAPDNRWIHRPHMDWDAAERRHDPATPAGRAFASILRLARARRSQLALRAGGQTSILGTDNKHVFAYRRLHPRSGPFLAAVNFSDVGQSADAALLRDAGIPDPVHVHSTAGSIEWRDARLYLPAWGFSWICGP